MLVLVSMGLGALGAVAFGVGIGAAFGRSGNWANHLAGTGVGLWLVAAVINVIAVCRGIRVVRRTGTAPWWWVLSVLLLMATAAGGWFVSTL